MRQVNEMLVVFAQFCYDLLISFKLPTGVLHRVENKYSFGDIIIFMCCKPVRENSIRRTGVFQGKLLYFDARTFESSLKVIEL